MATTVLTPTVPASADRRAPWRSPAGQPAYARPALLVIVACAAVLYAWGINHSQYHSFYANAVRSMTTSWKAFFYGSFDPGNSITLDKLPGFLWPQAISARVFGFHPWAVTLPQVLEGVASLLVLYRVVRRWAGVNAALIASAAFLVTPVAAGLFRTAVEDPAFTLCVLLAASATQRAAASGRLRPLLLAGVWVGLGFQAKMLEAWAVLPALAVVYLMAAPVSRRKRIGHVLLAGLVTIAVSVSWMLAVTLTPAKDRPYVDGTTDNSVFSMVVGYNFLNRFSSLGISAASTGSVSATQGGFGGHGGSAPSHSGTGAGAASGTGSASGAGSHAGAGAVSGFGGWGGGGGGGHGRTHRAGGTGPGGAFAGRGGAQGSGGQAFGGQGSAGQGFAGQDSGAAGGSVRAGGGATATAAHRGGGGGFGGGQQGWAKMFGTSLATQTGWLYPIGAIAVICGLLWRRRKPRTDLVRAGFAMWGLWLATYFLVFSAGSVGGHTYYMGVVAVPLAALTGGGVVQLWRAYRAGGRRAWALPAAVAATVTWGAYLTSQFTSFLPWLAPVEIGLGVLAVVLLALARPGGRITARGRIALAGLLAGLAAMLIAPSAWAAQVFDPTYGRMSMMGSVGPTTPGAQGGRGFGGFRGTAPPVAAHGSPGGAERAGGAGRGGGMAGGFGFGSGSGTLTASQKQLLSYVGAHRGKAKYVFATTSWSTASPFILATGADVLPLGGFTGKVPSPSLSQFQQMVTSGQVEYVLAGGTRGGMGGFGGFGGFGGGSGTTSAAQQISNWATSSCTAVPVKDYGGTAGGQRLYDCSRRH
ncbi:glycosyltransferase family 39 protein [Streptomyces sp. ICBB 8177]|uniref:ArnT family glycosyltransferase n=1 Tax=Streptomyces sp. ICBB 8177 TaxID=563922 RepID=UPI000D67922D|nr:glycosyltransferase family 39 protein [Streptomyces sp. ICBB 8177]PWI43643.1 mannosyltransferase [Streptomyces sp. ICBB 8177]